MKKDLIADSAIVLLAEKGYANTTTRMISESAEIAVGTIYTNFKNKEGILDYIFQTEYDKREAYLKVLLTSNSAYLEKLNRFLDFHFSELSKNEKLALVLIQESSNPELSHLAGIQNFIQQIPDFFKTILVEAMANGEVRPLDPELTAEIIFSTIRGTVLNVAGKNALSDSESIQKELKSFITHAVQKR
ncbi:TetR/AcrR family transcriptional regulator [Acidaminobacter hydrogenoformans]|uniref:Transcriptional regulator, TetR family n=1 Tax=Acidaminobacter hydrogenoformans DSM 2784 TaxID=1120920 RepID=A0A1G5S684_9FIRM|nr:TetR/AcrR family transcriptional regulator [Acidaminobacter hydrogenoformans]SCZ81854.1 transcriptional regulator, TetR family [Acidaminobacter hydrogenoformans DSM 2784]